MILKCEYVKPESNLIVVSTLNVEVDDADAQAIMDEPYMMNGNSLICIAATPYTHVVRKSKRK